MGLAMPEGELSRAAVESVSAPARTAVAGFRAFGAYSAEAGSPRQWIASLAASSTIYVAIGIAALTIGTATTKIVQEKKVDLKFVEKVVQEPPPPPPQVDHTE